MPGTGQDEDEVLAAMADARRTLDADGVPDLDRLQRLLDELTSPGPAVLDELLSLLDGLATAHERTGSSLQRLHTARAAGAAYARQNRLHR